MLQAMNEAGTEQYWVRRCLVSSAGPAFDAFSGSLSENTNLGTITSGGSGEEVYAV
jgi:hypothetical protein